MTNQLTGSEALYGFAGWLTTRDTEVIASAHHDAAIWAELVQQFCETNKLDEPRENWSDYLTHPSD